MLKEPEIKLFGRNISYPENGGDCSGECSAGSSNESGDCDRCSEESRGEEFRGEANLEERDEEQEGELLETTAEDVDQDPEESQNTNSSLSESHDSRKTPPVDDDGVLEDQPKNKEEQSGGASSEQKTLKKPDKILPCPRCKSMETKFCYYNNYNVNQPRHFCKSCQRYWTAGGTMRNMPVGAGKRKSKNSTHHCHHITLSDALQAARGDAPSGAVLSFGPDESMSLALKRIPNGLVSCKNGEEVDDTSLGSSVAVPNPSTHSVENGFQQQGMQNMTGFPSQVPCIPWPFPWNSAVPFPAIFPPGYPMPYYTVPLWNVPWIPVPPPADQTTPSSSPNSPLGKHSRSGVLLNPNTPEAQKCKSSESSIVIPKTLRIDDPEEAAKSSIWSTLGIKYNSISKDGLFKALQHKDDDQKPMANTSPLLQANPAALSRSLAFQESA